LITSGKKSAQARPCYALGGYTPLWYVAGNDHLDAIKWWIVSGREMDLGKPGDVYKTDAIGVAKKNGNTEVVTLLERFQSDAAETTYAMRGTWST